MNFFFVEGNDHGLKGVSDHVDVDSAGEDLDGDEKGGGDDVVEDSAIQTFTIVVVIHTTADVLQSITTTPHDKGHNPVTATRVEECGGRAGGVTPPRAPRFSAVVVATASSGPSSWGTMAMVWRTSAITYMAMVLEKIWTAMKKVEATIMLKREVVIFIVLIVLLAKQVISRLGLERRGCTCRGGGKAGGGEARSERTGMQSQVCAYLVESMVELIFPS
eukprot:jgi/Undpi1/5658/HiC_scaffold_2.g00932.m1